MELFHLQVQVYQKVFVDPMTECLAFLFIKKLHEDGVKNPPGWVQRAHGGLHPMD